MKHAYVVMLLMIVFASVLIGSMTIERSQEIPRIIWSFWNSNDVPPLIEKCIKSWKQHNPHYKIIILNNKTVYEYLPELHFMNCKIDTVQRYSDLIRLALLDKYGGFWLDASIILHESLDWLVEKQKQLQYKFVGYYLDGFTTDMRYPVVESWFLGCVPRCRFMHLWNLEFQKLLMFGDVNTYVDKHLLSNTDIQNIDDPYYLAIHVACQKVMQQFMTVDQIQKEMYLLKAEDGPYKHWSTSNWNCYDSLVMMCKEKSENMPPVIKMVGPHREVIDDHPELMCIFKHQKKEKYIP